MSSVNVAFRGETFCRRRQLHGCVGAAYDDRSPTLTPLLTPTNSPSRAAIFKRPTREPFAGHLDEDEGTTGLHQHRRLRHRRGAHRLARVEQHVSGLSDQQLSVRIVDLELHGERTAVLINDAGIVHVVRLQRNEHTRPGSSKSMWPMSRTRATSAVGTIARSSTRSVRRIRKRCAPSSYERAQRRLHVGKATGNRSPKHERVARLRLLLHCSRFGRVVKASPWRR